MASNYDDVLAQLRQAGLLVDSLDVGRMRRCLVEGGGKEKRGWYSLHELRLNSGEDVFVGSYGVWQGTANNAQKVDLRKREITPEQRDAIKKRLAEDRRRADAERAAEAAKAAELAATTWRKLVADGDCDYLHRKGVGAHGVRFSPLGSMAIPMLDAGGKLHGLQVIRGTKGSKREKEYWPKGLIVTGHFHLLGYPAGSPVILVGEGYATAASVFEATGIPTAVAFDAGNLGPTVRALHARYKSARILICADDDRWSTGNPGVSAASAAALEVGGAFVVPIFADDAARDAAYSERGAKITDFNDLHALEGLHVVRSQIEARITALGWRQVPKAGAKQPEGAGVETLPAIQPLESLDVLLERFVLIYGQGGKVFDGEQHVLLTLSDMRDACLRRQLHRDWMEHPGRQIVRVEQVGFDPGNRDPRILCNLWGGWPTVPKAGDCTYQLDLLRYLCSEEPNAEDLYWWVLCWLAYPIQNPGAKMKTCLVMHGPQGTGKNLFFESVGNIYGQYGRIIDQSAVEDKFNDWVSRKLYVICDEVLARNELWQVKNRLKTLITGDTVRVNPKNMTAYDEANHMNLVFLSNESQPLVLEMDDRRHCVIHTPAKLSKEFYADAVAEIRKGGSAALHHYLLNLDLGDFGPATLPPMTEAKGRNIALSMDSSSRFATEFAGGEIPGFPAAAGALKLLTPCLTTDMFALYLEWCRKQNVKATSMHRFQDALTSRHGGMVQRKRIGADSNPRWLMYLPGGQQLPAGQNERDWLQDRVEMFQHALNDYRKTFGSAL